MWLNGNATFTDKEIREGKTCAQWIVEITRTKWVTKFDLLTSLNKTDLNAGPFNNKYTTPKNWPSLFHTYCNENKI